MRPSTLDELEAITAAEAAAVDAEDFERAAGLSASADEAKAKLASLQAALRRAEAACDAAVSRADAIAARNAFLGGRLALP